MSHRPNIFFASAWLPLTWLLTAALLVTGAGGCGGCRGWARRGNADADKAAGEKPKPKPDFEFVRLASLPNNTSTAEVRVKPGHWTSATLEAVAHNQDFQGELRLEGNLGPAGGTIGLETARPATLPKGQVKRFELLLHSPAILELNVNGPPGELAVRLTPSGKNRSVLRESFPLRKLLPQQFHFLVLARDPDRYQYLRALPTFVPCVDAIFDPLEMTHYFVQAPQIDRRAPLPTSLLHWTTTAAALWDDLDPAVLSPQQQEALVDWLHFGGQLVINGPVTLDQLAGSFLHDFLPAEAGPARELTDDDIASLNAAWSFEGVALRMSRPWSGVTLIPHPASETLAGVASPLVVERRVGRGRVVATGFSLGQRELLAWDGLDSFWNGCLLRRGKRTYRTADDGSSPLYWSDTEARGDMRLARRVSRLRIFSRDAGLAAKTAALKVEVTQPSVTPPPLPKLASDFSEPTYGPPVAQWNDSGPLATEALSALHSAAGIEIPDQRFVLRLLGGYLLIIVPANWLLFRLLGRVEWAWAAVPLVALAGAVVVTRMAQLDIGFARARTELGIVELHGGHPRAHVTRFTALYASLTTRYTVSFDGSDGVALPINGGRFAPGPSQTAVQLYRGQRTELRGFSVASNSLGILHAEHMQDVGGGIELANGATEVVNGSSLTLEGAQVFRDGRSAWIGRLSPGESAALDFSLSKGPVPSAAPLPMEQVYGLAAADVELGETRLVAWTAAPIEGISFEPAPPQVRAANLVIAHLQPGASPPAVRDDNARPYVERMESLVPQVLPEEGAP